MRTIRTILVLSLSLCCAGCGENPKEIFQACEKGDLAKVKAIVSAHPDSVKLLSEVGKMPPLYSAAVGGNPEIAEFLIAKGAEVNRLFPEGATGNTPLHLAIQKNHLKMVEALVKGGADVNKKNGMGFPMLHAAIQNKKSLEIIEFLISKGADVKAKEDFNGRTALELARKNNDPKLIELLEKHGAK